MVVTPVAGRGNQAGSLDHAPVETNASPTLPLVEPVKHWPPNAPGIAGCRDVRREAGVVQSPPVVIGAATACLTPDGTSIDVEAQGDWSDDEAVAMADGVVQLALDRLAWMSGPAGDLIALLPPTSVPPLGLPIDDDGSRSQADIAASFPSPTDARAKLQQWGWRANAYRTYVGDEAARGLPRRVEVSLQRFGSAADAAVIPYFVQGRAQALGLQPAAGRDALCRDRIGAGALERCSGGAGVWAARGDGGGIGAHSPLRSAPCCSSR